MEILQEWIKTGNPLMQGSMVALAVLGILICFLGCRFKKILLGILVFGIGLVTGFQLSRIWLGNVWICLGIGLILAVILFVLMFYFSRAGLFLICAMALFWIMKALLHQEIWWVYVAALLTALAAGITAICFERQMLSFISAMTGAYVASAVLVNLAGIESKILFWVMVLLLGVAGDIVQLRVTSIKKEKKEPNETQSRRRRRNREDELQEQEEISQRERHERRKKNRA